MIPGRSRLLRDVLLTLGLALAAMLLCLKFVAVPWTVAGDSMRPTLEAGDRVVVDLWSYRGRAPLPGEVALLLGPSDLPLVKRVAAGPLPAGDPLATATFLVLGDNREASADSRAFGPVPRDRFRGRVVWRYWPLSRAGPIR